MIDTINKQVVIRNLNVLGDMIKIKIDAFERITEFANPYMEGQIKGALQAMKDFQDNLQVFAENIGL